MHLLHKQIVHKNKNSEINVREIQINRKSYASLPSFLTC